MRRLPFPNVQRVAHGGTIGYRVLLVDDEPLIRKLIASYLVSAGYVVLTAVDGLDALSKLRAGLPDLIISDLGMHRMSGIELLEVIRKRFPRMPFMLTSAGYADNMPGEVAPDAYYQKSGLGFQDLLETVSALATKRPLRVSASPIDSEPVQARWDGNGQYTIECNDCLRPFSVPQVSCGGRGGNWAICVHCGKTVQLTLLRST